MMIVGELLMRLEQLYFTDWQRFLWAKDFLGEVWGGYLNLLRTCHWSLGRGLLPGDIL